MHSRGFSLTASPSHSRKQSVAASSLHSRYSSTLAQPATSRSNSPAPETDLEKNSNVSDPPSPVVSDSSSRFEERKDSHETSVLYASTVPVPSSAAGGGETTPPSSSALAVAATSSLPILKSALAKKEKSRSQTEGPSFEAPSTSRAHSMSARRTGFVDVDPSASSPDNSSSDGEATEAMNSESNAEQNYTPASHSARSATEPQSAESTPDDSEASDRDEVVSLASHASKMSRSSMFSRSSKASRSSRASSKCSLSDDDSGFSNTLTLNAHLKRRWQEISRNANDDTIFTSNGVKQLHVMTHVVLLLVIVICASDFGLSYSLSTFFYDEPQRFFEAGSLSLLSLQLAQDTREMDVFVHCNRTSPNTFCDTVCPSFFRLGLFLFMSTFLFDLRPRHRSSPIPTIKARSRA